MPSSSPDPALETALLRYQSWLQARGVSNRGRICFISRLRRYLRWFHDRYLVDPFPLIHGLAPAIHPRITCIIRIRLEPPLDP